MKKVLIFLVSMVFILLNFSYLQADTRDEEIQALKTQVQDLLGRIEKLEKERLQEKALPVKKEEAAKKAEPRVDLANALSKLKIKGRAALGFYNAEKEAASYAQGSFEVPDAKLQLSFQPDEINTLVLRFNLNNSVTSVSTTSPLLDYFFLSSKDFLPALKDSPFSLSARLGKFKSGFGEETWSNNAIEGVLPSNSVGAVDVVDEGLEFSGKVKLEKMNLKPLGWVVSISDGNAGVGADNSQAKAFLGKLSYAPIEPLSFSVSYYDSGRLKSANSEFKIAVLNTVPAGAQNWERKVWEVDARYDFGKGKKPLDSALFSDSKAVVKFSYGSFSDSVSAAGERSGNFGFAEGIYNLNSKVYAAGRISFVDLDSDVTASLNNVTCNKYQRYSIGTGYRLRENTILKLAYDWNKESGPGISDLDNDLLSLVAATQF